MDTTPKTPAAPQAELAQRLRESADEVMEFPHPSQCDHFHDAAQVMREAANALDQMVTVRAGIGNGTMCGTAVAFAAGPAVAAHAIDRLALSEPQETPAHHALRALASHMAKTFYPEVPQWKPLSDLLGLTTQIDNMVTGLVRLATAKPAAWVFPRVYGSGVQFPEPVKPEFWDDLEYGKWYCTPLYRGPAAK